MSGATTYNPYRSAVPEFVSDYPQIFEFDSDGLGNMTGKISTETVSPQKSIGDNLNYQFDYVYDGNYAHRLVRAGERYYQYDENGNVICEQDAPAPKAQSSITSSNANDGQSPAYGSFEDNGEDVAYHKVKQEAEDVYSTDYGWGLFKDGDGEGGHGASAPRYRRTYTWDEKNRLVRVDYPDTVDTLYTYGGANDSNGAAGKILRVDDASGTLEYEYGRLGEVTKETRTLATHLNGLNATETAAMEYRSDYLGRMQWIAYPDGEKVSCGYDAGGQVVSVYGECWHRMSVAVFYNVASLFRPHVAGNLAVFAFKVLSLHVLVFSARIARKRLERGAVVVRIDVGEPNLVARKRKA